MATRHLPAAAQAIAAQQGWNEESLVIHLAGFIQQQGQNDKLAEYLGDVASEETTVR